MGKLFNLNPKIIAEKGCVPFRMRNLTHFINKQKDLLTCLLALLVKFDIKLFSWIATE